ncbi:MAG: hypothetical protein Q9226_001355 [Calogaya cf. arnoldii]
MSRSADLDRLNELATAMNAQVMVIQESLAEHPDSHSAPVVRSRMADQAFSNLNTVLQHATAGIQRLKETFESDFNDRQVLAEKEKARFQDRQKKLDEREKKIGEREKNIDVQYGRLYSRENELSTRDKELSTRVNQLNSRDKELNSREKELFP